MSLERIDRLIAALRDESYQPKPSRRTYIPKKNGKLRPLGIPSIDDKLVQEVVRMLLESIYENSFEDTSHGFRPDRSCHTALRMIQNRFTRCKWFVEGDIKGLAVLKYQQQDSLNTVLPIGVRKIDAMRTLTTESLAVFIPFKVQEIMDEGGIYYGENAISHNLIMCNKEAHLKRPSTSIWVYAFVDPMLA